MTPIFPTVYSTLSPSALAGYIAEQYGLTNCTGELLVRGVGDTYQIRTAVDPYICRVYRSSHRTLPHIQAELELLLKLKAAGGSVSSPVADRTGTYIHPLEAAEGRRYAVLFTWAPGKVVSNPDQGQLQSLGREMARFHIVSSATTLATARWNYDLETTLREPLGRLKPAFAENPEEYAWWMNIADRVGQELGRFHTADFALGYCQYDFLPKNFHFQGDQVTLFDFDFLGYGWLINDIMTFWVHLCLEVYFSRMTQEQADQSYAIFLQAYQEFRPLGKEELEAVPCLLPAWWCYYMGFYTTHDQFTPLLQPAQLRARTGLVRQLTERYWK